MRPATIAILASLPNAEGFVASMPIERPTFTVASTGTRHTSLFAQFEFPAQAAGRAALWMAAHSVPFLTVAPAGAVETALDTAELLDVPASTIPEAASLQYAALAVTFLSVLPTPGMLGIGKDVSVTDNEATKARKAKKAKEAAAKSRTGKPKMLTDVVDGRGVD